MAYAASLEKFNETFINKSGKFTHEHQKNFKLFPFVTSSSRESIADFNQIVGGYINRIIETEPKVIEYPELIEQMKKELSIEIGKEKIFEEVIRFLFFDKNGQLVPKNLRTMIQNDCQTGDEIRLVNYLVDVLGNTVVIQELLNDAFNRLDQQSNVLEKSVFSYLKTEPSKKNREKIPYYKIIEIFEKVYEEDFSYIISSKNRTNEYLGTLLEFYYFVYTIQVCLHLEQFTKSDRNKCIPLYFALEWEKTSQSRLCYTEGWNKKIEPAIKKMYAHAVALEIINQTKGENAQLDYIDLGEMANQSKESDIALASEIRKLTDTYRKSKPICDCAEISKMHRMKITAEFTNTELKFLFDSIVCQFINSKRLGAYQKYSKYFLDFTEKFLKSRGRSGKVLNITEEKLIFLTKIVIKNEEKIRLNDVFKEFERRGVFLDNFSKEQVMKYYEKLNLIEKKSDSGDAQYVKRIL